MIVCNLLTLALLGSFDNAFAATTAEPIQNGCEEGWNLYEDQCYQIHGFDGVGALTWDDAKYQCWSYGGNLATILTPDAQAFLTASMEFEFTDVWIGLSNIDPDRRFRWESDNSVIAFESWGRQQPDGYPNGGEDPPTCVVMMSTRTEAGDWNDQNCSRELPYYCQKPTDPTLTPPPDTISLCNAGYESYFQSCFKFYRAPKTFIDAEAVCVAEGTHLASITDAYEEAYLESVLYRQQQESAWIGLQASNQSKTYEWTNGWPVYYTLWGSGEPSGGPGEDCVEATTGRNWDDTSCSKEQPFMCKYTDVTMPTPVPTSEGYCDGDWVAYGSSCYLFEVEQMVDWDTAELTCANGGGILLTVHSVDENNFISGELMKTGPVGNVWIGVKKNQEGGFEYLDGEPVNYVNWATGEPHSGEDECVVMHPDVFGHWMVADCGTPEYYGCKKPKLSPTPTGPAGGCPSGWHQYEYTCYQIHGYADVNRLNWNDAMSSCHDYHGELASILSPDIQAFLTASMEFEVNDVWIGLSNLGSDGQFHWILENSPPNFTSWGRNQPDGYPGGIAENPPACVVMMSTRTEAGDWNDQSCDRELPYYCQRPLDPTLTPPPDAISLCNADYESYFQSCFKFFRAPKTFSDAEAVCIAEGTHLASITDAYEEAYLESVLYREQQDSAWIGLQMSTESKSYEWTNDWPVYYTLWGSGEPSGGPGEGCVEATTGRNWDDTSCSKEQPFMCKYTDVSRPTTPPTSVGYCLDGWVEFGSYCYRFTTQSTATFADAKSVCASNDGTLLTVHSTAENAFILEQTTSSGSVVDDMWLGVTKNEDDGYEYLDGEPVNFANWATGEPRTGIDDCVVMQTDVYGHWAVADCLRLFAYGCKREKADATELPQTTDEGEEPEGLSAGQITGIVLGVIGFLLFVVTLGMLIFYKRKQIIPRERFFNETEISYNNKAL